MTERLALCPSCGLNLRAEAEELRSGPFSYTCRGGLWLAGERLRLPHRAHELIGGVLLARGRVISAEALTNRVGYDGDHGQLMVHVQFSRARQAVRERGEVLPITTIYGLGFRWGLSIEPERRSVRSLDSTEAGA